MLTVALAVTLELNVIVGVSLKVMDILIVGVADAVIDLVGLTLPPQLHVPQFTGPNII